MKLKTLHKRLSLQAMNPKDKNAEAKARSVGYNIGGVFTPLKNILEKFVEAKKPVKIKKLRKKKLK